MSVQAVLLIQMGSLRKLWSQRFDLRVDVNWETDLLAMSQPLWPEQWKPGEFFASSTKSGFAVYTALEDVVLYALGDEELGELGLQQYLDLAIHVVLGHKKKDTRLSRALLEDYPTLSTVLFDTVSPGGIISYTSLSDE